MRPYLELLERVRKEGVRKDDRTGTGTLSVFGHQMRFDLAAGFPLTTTKKLHLKSIAYELLWFLAGDTNIKVDSVTGLTTNDFVRIGYVGHYETRQLTAVGTTGPAGVELGLRRNLAARWERKLACPYYYPNI